MDTIKGATIVVVGGGYAGTFAAIAAARELRRLGQADAKVILVQERPVLGGTGSSEIRVPPIGAGRAPWAYETGLIHEYMLEERRRNHTRWDYGLANSITDLVLWEMATAEPNLELMLNTSVRTVTVGGTQVPRIESVHASQLGTEGEFTIAGDLFVDATGDGSIGAAAGADFWIGREAASTYGESFAPEAADDHCMGSTLLFQAIDVGEPVAFAPPEYAHTFATEESLAGRPIVDFRSGYWWIEVGVPYHTINDNEIIRDELLRYVLGVWDHVKNRNPRFREDARNWALDWFGWVPGKRESRRLAGDYVLVEDDLRTRRSFDDRVAYGGHFLDIHTMGGILTAARGEPGNPVDINPELWDQMRVAPYSIPFRSLYSRNVPNLMMAGRDISASHVANGSARVMLTTSVIGQATGTGAAVCIARGLTPREVAEGDAIREVQQALLRQGCFIPHLINSDEADLARQARAESTSDALLNPPERDPDGWRSMDHETGLVVPLSDGRIDEIALLLRSEVDHDVELSLEVYPIQDVWDANAPQQPISSSVVSVPANATGWVSFEPRVDVAPRRCYRLALSPAPGLSWAYQEHLPTGVVGLWRRSPGKRWLYADGGRRTPFQCFFTRLAPSSRPYGAANTVNGVTRPESWPNIWISDPGNPLPQSVTLSWQRPIVLSRLELTFDTNLSKTNELTPGLHIPPELVREYSIEHRSEGEWVELVRAGENIKRQRAHLVGPIEARQVRVSIHKTWGDPSARIYEIRAYGSAD